MKLSKVFVGAIREGIEVMDYCWVTGDWKRIKVGC